MAVVALWLKSWTIDQQVKGSNPSTAKLPVLCLLAKPVTSLLLSCVNMHKGVCQVT